MGTSIQDGRVRYIWEVKIEEDKNRGKPKQTWDKEVIKILEIKGNI